VADTLNRRIVALDAQGRWLWVSGLPDAKGRIRGFWQLPRGIELGPDGNLYVVDTFRFDQKGMGTGHIVVLSSEGELLSEFGRAGNGTGEFSFPEHLAYSPVDDLWAIADRENQRVVVFRLETPYPKVDDLQAPKYAKGLTRPEDVWATPTPSPAG
jgi:DNA-binding beta-propeller fold protein YncE